MANNLLQLFPTEQAPTTILSTRVIVAPVEDLPSPQYSQPASFPAESAMSEVAPDAAGAVDDNASSCGPDRQAKSNNKPVLGKIYAAVIVLLACGVGCYEFTGGVFLPNLTHASQPQKPAPVLEPQTVVVTAAADSQTPVAPSVPAKITKPSPGVLMKPDSNLAQGTTAPIPGTTEPSTPSQTGSKSTRLASPLVTELRQASNAPTPVFASNPAPSRSAQTLAAKSGVLHYQGRPVPYGGVVFFSNLPAQRLKYSFDHSSWQLSLTNNPDGTRKGVQLTSIKQGIQANCDLGWEVIQ